MDLAYIWDSEVQQYLSKIKKEAGKLAFIFRKAHSYYKLNPELYARKIEDLKNLIRYLNKIEAKERWIKQIDTELGKLISDAEAEIKFSQEGKKSVRRVYRGIWAQHLDTGDELPIGGHILSSALTTRIKLDFDAFDGFLQNYKSPEAINANYIKINEQMADWFRKLPQKNPDFDLHLFFVCSNVGKKVMDLLSYNPDKPTDGEKRADTLSRTPKLSAMKGCSMCAELAAMGQYLMQKVLIPSYASSYFSGVTVQDPSGDPEDHSFIVLWNRETPNKTYIFDIARPHSQHQLPRILETDYPFYPGLFKGKENLVVGATDVLDGKRLYYGVGNRMSPEPVEILERKGG
ncbi:hypothetical protein HYU14_03360 [Candidatus Woesearchaeota archaeon]|nr:hypothetical protein [Candidatus Woesearchaeota archaeon]